VRFSSRLATVGPLVAALMLTTGIFGHSDFADVTTVNKTQYELWVDVSYNTFPEAFYHINKAFCMKPRSSYEQRYNFRSKQGGVRVRAEIKLHGCASGTHTVVEVVHKLSGGTRFTSTIYEGSPNRFYITDEH
jgi:hypothetical protein